MNDEQLKKLPQYAQLEIERLRRDVIEFKNQRDILIDGPRARVSRVTIADGMDNLPVKEATYRFQLGTDSSDCVDVRINKGEYGTELTIMGGGPLLIYPRVSNVVSVKLARQCEDSK